MEAFTAYSIYKHLSNWVHIYRLVVLKEKTITPFHTTLRFCSTPTTKLEALETPLFAIYCARFCDIRFIFISDLWPILSLGNNHFSFKPLNTNLNSKFSFTLHQKCTYYLMTWFYMHYSDCQLTYKITSKIMLPKSREWKQMVYCENNTFWIAQLCHTGRLSYPPEHYQKSFNTLVWKHLTKCCMLYYVSRV